MDVIQMMSELSEQSGQNAVKQEEALEVETV